MRITLKDFIKKEALHLSSIYDEKEAQSIIKMLLSFLIGDINNTDLMLGKELPGDFDFNNWLTFVNRLKQKEPIQYITEQAWFGENLFFVKQGVLIPREETYELVQLILLENKEVVEVLDLCTGSGCIAISLAKSNQNYKVSAVDISEIALEIANVNNKKLLTNVNFIQDNVLDFKQNYTIYDVIVSNPPYVTNAEKNRMHANVLEHEPHLALFVEDEEPLIFYKAIAVFATTHLKKGGKLYFEINEQFGEETKTLLQSLGFEEVSIIKDIHQKDRFVTAIWN